MREREAGGVGSGQPGDSGWRRLRLRFPEAHEDEVSGRLWLAGTAGIEEVARRDGEVEIFASFTVGTLVPSHGPGALPAAGSAGVKPSEAAAAAPGDLAVRTLLPGELLGALDALGVAVLGIEVVIQEDWLARYRESVQPIAVGRGLLVDPREPDVALPLASDRRLLRLPVRSAFGVGSHESTRLAVELLEDAAAAGRVAGARVLDVGTGTGILAFYALLLGARWAVGFDLDLEAAVLAHQNRALNDLRPALYAGTSAAVAAQATFDLVVVNVLPEEVEGELERLVAALAAGGELIFSGVLATRGPGLRADLARLGLGELVGERRDGEWVAFRLARRAASDGRG